MAKIITLSSPITLHIHGAAFPTVSTSILYTVDEPTLYGDDMVQVEITSFSVDRDDITPFNRDIELAAFGGNQTLVFKASLIKSIAPIITRYGA